MVYRTTTELDFKVYEEFNRFSLSKRGFMKSVASPLKMVIFAVVALLALFLAVKGEGDIAMWICFGAMTLFFILTLYLYFFSAYVKKSAIESEKTVEEYCFSEEMMSVITRSTKASTNNNYSYDAFESVYETKGFYYFYLNPMIAYVVDKSKVSEGNAEEFSGFLEWRLGTKKFMRKY